MDAKFSIKNGKLIAEIPLGEPRPSASGITQVAATSNGFLPTGLTYKDKPMKISFNITVPK